MVVLLWWKRLVMAVNTSTSGSWGFLTLNRKRGGFFSMVKSKQCDLNREEVREQVRGMMMTVCDIAGITKPWPIQKQVKELFYSGFRCV